MGHYDDYKSRVYFFLSYSWAYNILHLYHGTDPCRQCLRRGFVRLLFTTSVIHLGITYSVPCLFSFFCDYLIVYFLNKTKLLTSLIDEHSKHASNFDNLCVDDWSHIGCLNYLANLRLHLTSPKSSIVTSSINLSNALRNKVKTLSLLKR